MAESPKHLRAAIKSLLRDTLVPCGFSPMAGDSNNYSNDALVQRPLVAAFLSDAQTYKFGGIRVGFSLNLRCPACDTALAAVPDSALSPRAIKLQGYGISEFALDHVPFSMLTEDSTNEKFVYVAELAQVSSAAGEIVEALRGPGEGWFRARANAAAVLQAAMNDAPRPTDLTIRSLALLACEHDRIDVAETLLAAYSPMGGDTAERIDAFGAFVAERYGQRLDPQVNR